MGFLDELKDKADAFGDKAKEGLRPTLHASCGL